MAAGDCQKKRACECLDTNAKCQTTTATTNCVELLQGRGRASIFIPERGPVEGRADLHWAPIRTSEGGKGGERASECD